MNLKMENIFVKKKNKNKENLKMKKLLLLFIFIVTIFVGCLKDPSGNPLTIRLKSSNVIVVEGCEYFVVDAHSSYTYVHKGNCKNPIHYENRNSSK